MGRAYVLHCLSPYDPIASLKMRVSSVAIYHYTGIDIFLRVKHSVFRHMSPSEVEDEEVKKLKNKNWLGYFFMEVWVS